MQPIPTENLQTAYDFPVIFHITPHPNKFSPNLLLFIFSPRDDLFHLVGILLLMKLKQRLLIIFLLLSSELQFLEHLVWRTFCLSDKLRQYFFPSVK